MYDLSRTDSTLSMDRKRTGRRSDTVGTKTICSARLFRPIIALLVDVIGRSAAMFSINVRPLFHRVRPLSQQVRPLPVGKCKISSRARRTRRVQLCSNELRSAFGCQRVRLIRDGAIPSLKTAQASLKSRTEPSYSNSLSLCEALFGLQRAILPDIAFTLRGHETRKMSG